MSHPAIPFQRLRPYFRPVKRWFYRPDEFGIPEFITESTALRFWRFPSYWRYVALRNTGRRHELPIAGCPSVHYLTCKIPWEGGIGHQLACWSSAYIFARRHALRFVHFPLSNFPGEPWEDIFGLGEGELQYHEVLSDRAVRVVRLPRIRRLDLNDHAGQRIVSSLMEFEKSRGRPVLFRIHREHFVFDQPAVSKQLRQKYWRARNRFPVASLVRSGRINVGCHIRRGDLTILESDPVHFRARWLDSRFFVNVLTQVVRTLGGEDFDVHVFSDSVSKEFDDLRALGRVEFHLDTDPAETFHAMVCCDILVISPSSFSYSAGVISSGLKIARHPWWHEIPDGSGWIRADGLGNIESQKLSEWLLRRPARDARE